MKYHIWSFHGTGWDKTDFDELADAEAFADRNIGTTYVYPAVVPQCAKCRHWRQLTINDIGECQVLDIDTLEDFGCIRFEPKRTE